MFTHLQNDSLKNIRLYDMNRSKNGDWTIMTWKDNRQRMEIVKSTLGLGTQSVFDTKSEFFIFFNYYFCLIRLLDYRRSVIDYDRRETNMKKVRFIKNADKPRHKMNEQNIPVHLSTRWITSTLSLLCMSTRIANESYNNICHL